MSLLNVLDRLERRVDIEIKGYMDIAERIDFSFPITGDKEKLEAMIQKLNNVEGLHLAVNILLDYKPKAE